jgi:DnaJ family protein C protein 19
MIVKALVLAAVVALLWLWWRRSARPAAMTPREARDLLGVGPGASLDEIREAHRRLISRVHPDTGGSGALATRVNMARDTLVAELQRGPPRAS